MRPNGPQHSASARSRTVDGGGPERSTRQRDNLERLVQARPAANHSTGQRIQDRWDLAVACMNDALSPPLQRRDQTAFEYEAARSMHQIQAFATFSPISAFFEGLFATAHSWPGRGIIKPR
ncbi:MAG: hypothetical protein ACAI38_25255 [Myxococcota bacterium]